MMHIKGVMKSIKEANGSNCLTELLREAATDVGLRKSFLENPKRLIEERLGAPLPKGMRIIPHENTEKTVHISLPLDPSNVGLDEAQLDNISGGNYPSLDNPGQPPPQWGTGAGPLSMVLHNNSPLAQAIGGALVAVALSFIPV